MAKNVISKAAPETALEAYGHVQDLMEAVGAVKVAARSETHKLQLPAEAMAQLTVAHEALKTVHCCIEAYITGAAAPKS